MVNINHLFRCSNKHQLCVFWAWNLRGGVPEPPAYSRAKQLHVIPATCDGSMMHESQKKFMALGMCYV
jgi:hypothetical protein